MIQYKLMKTHSLIIPFFLVLFVFVMNGCGSEDEAESNSQNTEVLDNSRTGNNLSGDNNSNDNIQINNDVGSNNSNNSSAINENSNENNENIVLNAENNSIENNSINNDMNANSGNNNAANNANGNSNIDENIEVNNENNNGSNNLNTSNNENSINSENNNLPAELTSISPLELNNNLTNKDFLLINVHIPYAGEIPLTDIHISYTDIDAIILYIGDNLNTKVVVYCLSNYMSKIAGDALVEKGYNNIKYLDGGMSAWTSAGYELDYE